MSILWDSWSNITFLVEFASYWLVGVGCLSHTSLFFLRRSKPKTRQMKLRKIRSTDQQMRYRQWLPEGEASAASTTPVRRQSRWAINDTTHRQFMMLRLRTDCTAALKMDRSNSLLKTKVYIFCDESIPTVTMRYHMHSQVQNFWGTLQSVSYERQSELSCSSKLLWLGWSLRSYLINCTFPLFQQLKSWSLSRVYLLTNRKITLLTQFIISPTMSIIEYRFCCRLDETKRKKQKRLHTIATTLMRLKMARLMEVCGWASLDTITVPITTKQAIEKGTGMSVSDALTVWFKVLSLLVGLLIGMVMQTPVLAIIPGGHCNKQYSWYAYVPLLHCRQEVLVHIWQLAAQGQQVLLMRKGRMVGQAEQQSQYALLLMGVPWLLQQGGEQARHPFASHSEHPILQYTQLLLYTQLLDGHADTHDSPQLIREQNVPRHDRQEQEVFAHVWQGDRHDWHVPLMAYVPDTHPTRH